MRVLWFLTAFHSYAASAPTPPPTLTNLTVSTVLHVWQSILAWDPDGCKTMEHLLAVELSASTEWAKLTGRYPLMTQDKIWRILTHILGESSGTYGHLGHWQGGHRMADDKRLNELKTYLSNFGNRHKGYLGGSSTGRVNLAKAFEDLHAGLVETVKFFFANRNAGNDGTNASNQTTSSGYQAKCRFIVTKDCSPYSAPRLELPCNTTILPYFAGYCDCGWGVQRRVQCGTESTDAFTCQDTCLAGGMSEKVEAAFADVFAWITQYVSMSSCCGRSGDTFDSDSCEFVTARTYVEGATDAWCEKGEAVATQAVQTCFNGINLNQALRHTTSSWQILLGVDPSGCAMMDSFYEALMKDETMRQHHKSFTLSAMKDSLWKAFTRYWGTGPQNYGLMCNSRGTGLQDSTDLIAQLHTSLAQLGARHQGHSKEVMAEALELYENALIASLRTVIGPAKSPTVRPIGSLSTAPVQKKPTSLVVDGKTYDKYADFGDNCRFYWRQEAGYEQGAKRGKANHVYSKAQTMKIHVVAQCYFPVETIDDIGWCSFGLRKSVELNKSMMAFGDIMYFDRSAKVKRKHTITGDVQNLQAEYHFFNPDDLAGKWVDKEYCAGKFSFTEWQVSRTKNTAQNGGGYDNGVDKIKLTYAMGPGSEPTGKHFYAEAYEVSFVAESPGQKPAERLSNPLHAGRVKSGNVNCATDNDDPNCDWFFQDALVYNKTNCVCDSCKGGYVVSNGKCVPPPERWTTAMESAWRDVFRWMGNMMRMPECCTLDSTWNPAKSGCTKNNGIMHGETFLQNGNDGWCTTGAEIIAGPRDSCKAPNEAPTQITFKDDVLLFAKTTGDMDPPVSVYYWKDEKKRQLQLYFRFTDMTDDTMWCAAGINPTKDVMDGGNIVASVRHDTVRKEYTVAGETPVEVRRNKGEDEEETETGKSFLVAGSANGYFGQSTCGVYMRVDLDALEALEGSSVLRRLVVLSARGTQKEGIPVSAKLAKSVGVVNVAENLLRKCDGGCGMGGVCEDGKCNCKPETTGFTGENCGLKYCAHGKPDPSGKICKCSSGYVGGNCDFNLFLTLIIGGVILGVVFLLAVIWCCKRKGKSIRVDPQNASMMTWSFRVKRNADKTKLCSKSKNKALASSSHGSKAKDDKKAKKDKKAKMATSHKSTHSGRAGDKRSTSRGRSGSKSQSTSNKSKDSKYGHIRNVSSQGSRHGAPSRRNRHFLD